MVNPSEVFEFDAGNPIPSNPHTNFFVNDFLNINSLSQENKIQSSELVFKIGDSKELKVIKEYTSNSLKVFVDNQEVQKNIFEQLSEILGMQVDLALWSKSVVDCVKNNIENLDTLKSLLPQESQGDATSLITQASEGLSKEESEKLTRLRETTKKIKTMEGEVGSYQNQKKNKEELKKTKDKIDLDIKALEDKLSSVNMLTESQTRLKGELEKFSNITSDSTVHQKVEKIKELRSFGQTSSLKNMRKIGGVHMETEEKEGSLITGKWMIILVIAQLIFSLLFFIITLQLVQLLIGIFSAVVIIILMLLVNVNKYTFTYRTRLQSEEAIVMPVSQKTNPDEDQLILNTAWSKALKAEYDVMTATITARLGDKTLEQIMAEKQALVEEQKKQEVQVSDMDSKSLNTEEYYKKRRELDILKIEKENIEFSLEGKLKPEIESQIEALSSGSNQTQLPLLLVNCKFVNDVTDFVNNLKQSRQVLIINNA